MRSPAIFNKLKPPKAVEKAHSFLRLNNARPAQKFAKWSPLCAQCGMPASSRHLLFSRPPHADERLKLHKGIQADMAHRREENKRLQPAQRKKIVGWRDNLILQECATRVGSFLAEVLPGLPFFDHAMRELT